MRALALFLPVLLVACGSKIDANLDDTGTSGDGGSTDGGSTDGGTSGDGGGTTDGGGGDGGGMGDGGGGDGGGMGDGGGGDGGGGDGGGMGDGGGGDGGGGDGGGGDGGSSEAVAHSGRWTYTTVDVVSTSCEAVVDFLPTAEGSNFFVTDSSLAGFTKEIAELAESTVCTVGSGGSFTCADITGEFAVAEYDVMLPTSLSSDGVLLDDLHMQGSYQVDLDCVGDNCDLAEIVYGFTFPCAFDLDWTANHESAG